MRPDRFLTFSLVSTTPESFFRPTILLRIPIKPDTQNYIRLEIFKKRLLLYTPCAGEVENKSPLYIRGTFARPGSTASHYGFRMSFPERLTKYTRTYT